MNMITTTLTMGMRNIKRNPRRTIILVSACATGVIGILFASAFMNAFFKSSLETAYKTGLGHIQVRPPGFEKSRKMGMRLDNPKKLLKKVKEAAGGLAYTSGFSLRLEREAVVQLDTRSSGALLLGVEPESEDKVSLYHKYVYDGRYLNNNDLKSPVLPALIGKGMADKFTVRVGDYLVASFSNAAAESTSVRLEIVGLYNSSADAVDKTMVLVPRARLSSYIYPDEPAQASYVVGLFAKRQFSPKVKALLEDGPAGKHDVMDHVQLEPNMSKILEFSNSFMYIFYLILMTGFGLTLFNTVLMSVLERTFELGVMSALGTPRRLIFGLVLVESLVLALLGCLAGLVAGGTTTLLFANTGIPIGAFSEGLAMMGPMASTIYPSLTPGDIMDSITVTLIVSVLASVYPSIKAARMKPVEALQFKK